MDDWNDFQFTFLGPNSVSVVQNAPSAQSKGIETNVEWQVNSAWLLSASATAINAKLTSNFCGSYIPGTETLTTNCPTQVNGPYADGTTTTGPLATNGTRLPVVPDFKANLVSRYSFPLGDYTAYAQAAYVYQDSSVPLMYTFFYNTLPSSAGPHLGELPPYSLVNLAAGVERNNMQFQVFVSNVFNSEGELTRFAACTPTTCTQPYVSPVQPRTFVIKFGQKF